MRKKQKQILLGVHCSIRKGLSNSLEQAKILKCNTMQIFTHSPRIWYTNYSSIPDETFYEFSRKRREYGINPVIIHVPYLPNLATSNETLYEKSIDILTKELEISSKLQADYFVLHTGAYSFGSTPEYGIKRVAEAIDRVLDNTSVSTKILFENVSGGGRRLGSTFEELHEIIKRIKDKKRTGICLDTAHLFAAGYPLRNKKEVNSTIEKFSDIIGLNYLKVIHLNDSFFPFSSRRDRHQHIGKGFIGKNGFGAILNHPRLISMPFILETPKESLEDDKRNLKTAIKLAR